MSNAKVDVSPRLLQTLRESSGYTIDSLAKELKRPLREIGELEDGTREPTVKIIHKLATVYRRPLAIFFTKELPKLPTITDFRINRDQRLSPRIYLAERRAYYLAQRVSEFTDIRSKLPFYALIESPQKLANLFREKLFGDSSFQANAPQKGHLSWYKNHLEDKYHLIVVEFDLRARGGSNDVRAFSLDTPINIIVLNESDASSVKLFSLFHEVCHLLRRESGICSIELKAGVPKPNIERFCNSFAAKFLIPSDDLDLQVKQYDKSKKVGYGDMKKLSERYGVSRQAMSIELSERRIGNALSYEDYEASIIQEDEKEAAKRKGKKGGVPKTYWIDKFRNRVGSFALKQIESAYREERISYSDVLQVSGLGSKYVKDIMGIDE